MLFLHFTVAFNKLSLMEEETKLAKSCFELSEDQLHYIRGSTTLYQLHYIRSGQPNMDSLSFSFLCQRSLILSYRIRVQAVNAIGAGAFSAQAKVTTLSLPPSPPCLECSSATWNTIKLRWSEVDKCDQYTVMMSRSATGVQQSVCTAVIAMLC